MNCKLVLALVLACFGISSLASATDGFFNSKGVKIRYVTVGKGEPVVLIHGWMGDSSMWGRDAKGNTKLNADGLPGFQVIALDCRGHGKSDKPHDPLAYGPEMAKDVVRLLDHLKVKKAHLVGYSMGAFIAGKVVADHPERVLSIIYGGQAPLIAGQSNGSKEVDAFVKASRDGDLSAYVIAVMPTDRPKPTPEQAQILAKFMFDGKDVKALAAAGRSFPELAVAERALVKGKVPTLFLYGSKESAHLKERIAGLVKAMGRGEVRVVEGADHVTAVIKPEFGAAIVGFLTAQKRLK